MEEEELTIDDKIDALFRLIQGEGDENQLQKIREMQKILKEGQDGIKADNITQRESLQRFFLLLDDLKGENTEQHKKIDQRLEKGDRRFKRLEEKLKEKDIKNGFKDKEVEDLEDKIKKVEKKIEQKADKTSVDDLSGNVWKLMIAIIGGSITILVLLMGILLRGGIM
jgi:septation ring formation regulator EzrA